MKSSKKALLSCFRVLPSTKWKLLEKMASLLFQERIDNKVFIAKFEKGSTEPTPTLEQPTPTPTNPTNPPKTGAISATAMAVTAVLGGAAMLIKRKK